MVRTLMIITIATLAATFLIYGFFLRHKLQHGKECDMTWSVIRFICLPKPEPEIDFKKIPRNTRGIIFPYRLLKFTDGRDKRYDHLVDYNKPDQDDQNTYEVVSNIHNWCQSGNSRSRQPGHIVLYVPGHDGNYQQARSLGAHGLNLTRREINPGVRKEIMEQLWDGTKNASANDIDDFLFDVYTVDFNGEGSVLHGSRLFAQAKFVVMALEKLKQECGVGEFEHISIVAHSVGGLVARKAVLEVNQKQLVQGENLLVRNVITLASPHSYLPFVFEPSVHLFYKDLLEQEIIIQETYGGLGFSLISISGGLRDELIPSSACETGNNYSLSILASDIMYPRTEMAFDGQKFGVDHKAIVWCHGLLNAVREILHTMSISSFDSHVNILKLLNDSSLVDDCNFQCRNVAKDQLLVDSYGSVGAMAIKTSMIWNFRSVVYLYGMNSVLHTICIGCSDGIQGYSYLFCPILSAVILSVVDELPIGLGSTIILSFNAMSVYYFILYGLFPVVSSSIKVLMRALNKASAQCDHSGRKHDVKVYLKQQLLWALTLLGLLVILLFTKFTKNQLIYNAVSKGSLLFLTLAALLVLNIINLACWPRVNRPQIHHAMASMLIVVFPLSLVGKITFALSLLTDSGQKKAGPYMDFERSQWDNFCNNSSDIVCATASIFFKFDLSRYAIYVCLPLYVVIMWTSCREPTHNTQHVEMKKLR